MKWLKNLIQKIANLFKKPEPKTPIPDFAVPVDKPPVRPSSPATKPSKFEFKKGMVGVDISHHNRNVDLPVLAKNVDFIYMKATEGATFVSKTFESRAEELKQLDVAWGAYHYYRVNKTPLEQANHFLNYIDVESGLPPVLDIEEINNNFKPYHKKDLLTFLRLIESKTKITPIIYTGYYFAKDVFMPTEEFAKYELWMPWYTEDFSRVKTPKPWNKITIWQHTDSGSIKGVEGNVDVNKVV